MLVLLYSFNIYLKIHPTAYQNLSEEDTSPDGMLTSLDAKQDQLFSGQGSQFFIFLIHLPSSESLTLTLSSESLYFD